MSAPKERLLICFLALFSVLGSSSALKAVDLFKICKRNDPKLNDCIKESIMQLRSTFKKGIPELKIPSLDPMIVPQIGLNQGSGPVSITSSFKDLHIENFSTIKIEDVKFDLSKYQIDLRASLDWFYTNGDYDMRGQILVLPISGNGPSWSNYTEVFGRGLITGHPVSKKNKTYFGVDDVKFDMDVGHATIHMDNLFNGNKALGDTMNRFISENWKVVYSELKPVINEAVSTIFKNVVEKIFNKFSLDELIPM